MRRRTLAQLVVVGMLLALAGGGTGAQSAGEPGVVHFTAAGDFGSNGNTRRRAGRDRRRGPRPHSRPRRPLLRRHRRRAGLVRLRHRSRSAPGYPFELLSGNHESNGQNGNINDFSACLPNQLPGVVGTYGRQ